jgi:NAD(P)-dependent dehydrogenase (short-subunit alcohol dehydrogenase family)
MPVFDMVSATGLNMPGRLQDKIALVFGAGSVGPGWGNGKATATLFAREGAHVVCVDFNPDAARETVDIITCEGGSATSAICDVTRSDQVQEVVDGVVAKHNRIDVLHNNVGYATMGGPIELTESEWHKTIDLNVTGCFVTCKHVLPHMLARRSGAIVTSLRSLRSAGLAILMPPITPRKRRSIILQWDWRSSMPRTVSGQMP